MTKRLFAISLLLSLVAVSATADAGSTISDKSYWPSEARQTTQAVPAVSRRALSSAFAYDRSGSESQFSPVAAGAAWRYQGGPKSH
jgi:hypothetical protein